MKGILIYRFGGPEVLEMHDVALPSPGAGEVLVRVAASGVGPWDALIRSGKSDVAQRLPLTPGSDISGVVEAAGPGVTALRAGDQVFGVTNSSFIDGYAEYAAANAAMIAAKPKSLGFIEAASVPVVAVTAWPCSSTIPGFRAVRRSSFTVHPETSARMPCNWLIEPAPR